MPEIKRIRVDEYTGKENDFIIIEEAFHFGRQRYKCRYNNERFGPIFNAVEYAERRFPFHLEKFLKERKELTSNYFVISCKCERSNRVL